MGVYIKGMKMPIDCNTCYISECSLPYSKVVPIGYRHEECPLVEVKEPHGRLVDADEIITQMNEMQVEGETFTTAVNYVKLINADAPTVIDSEE